MYGKRSVGLSSKQSVPRLLSVIRTPTATPKMKEVDVDAPPLSSSDTSDDDGLATRGDIQSSHFGSSRKGKSPPTWRARDVKGSREATAPADRFKRARTSTRPSSEVKPPASRQRNAPTRSETVDSDTLTGSPAPKKSKKSSPENEEQGIQFGEEPFGTKKNATSRHRYGKTSSFSSKSKRRPSPTKNAKRPTKEPTPEERPDRYKLKLPSPPLDIGEGVTLPTRKFKAIPENDFDSQAKMPLARKKRLRMPPDDSALLSGAGENVEASQRPVFKMPDALPDSLMGDIVDKFDFTSSQATDTLDISNPRREIQSSLTEPEAPDPAPVCPFCKRQVEQQHLDEFNTNNPRRTLANMRRFCDQHRLHQAKVTWVDKGYPDIDWDRLEERITRHYDFLSEILAGRRPSYYDDRFAAVVRSGRNRNLFQSDANLTPGYYGIRGLRAMTEQMICALAPLLRERSQVDKVISARGHTMYLQSVLVPELAVRLVMEDMGVTEEEAREILEESTEVGELLNDEIPDVVLPDSDDESGLEDLRGDESDDG